MEEDGRPVLESVGLDEVQDQDQDEQEDQDQDEDGDGADEHEENANSGSGSSAAQPGSPNSPLLVESDKDKQPADGENNKEASSGAAVNSDMILEALESLDHKNLRGTSLEQILDFLLRTYPVSRDRGVLRAELSGCLQSAVEQGLVRLNQNGSYRLASFHEEATEREHGHDPGQSRPGSSKDKDGQGRRRGRRGAEQKAPKPAAKPRRGRTPASEDSEDSDWRPPSSTPSPSRGRGGKRGRRRSSGKATRKSPRLHSSPGSAASSPSPGRAATPRAPRPAPRAATPAPTAPAKPQRAPGRASTPAPRRTPKAAVRKRKAAATRARSSSRGSSRGSSRASSSRRQPAAKRRKRM